MKSTSQTGSSLPAETGGLRLSKNVDRGFLNLPTVSLDVVGLHKSFIKGEVNLPYVFYSNHDSVLFTVQIAYIADCCRKIESVEDPYLNGTQYMYLRKCSI